MVYPDYTEPHFSAIHILYEHYQTDLTFAEDTSFLLHYRNGALNNLKASIYTSTANVWMAETSCRAVQAFVNRCKNMFLEFLRMITRETW